MSSDKILKDIKKTILAMVHKARASHVGAALSVADILYVLYFKVADITKENIKLPQRDKVILSKGHASVALYSVLYHRGFIPKDCIDGYAMDNGTLPCHIDKNLSEFLEASTGSLGHGAGLGVGMALAKKIDKISGHVYVICGDGECNEGSVWEAVMFASTHKLNNITFVVDFNSLQAFGKTNEVINQVNLKQRFEAFGFDAVEIDGHNLEQIENALKQRSSKPIAIIAKTVKGKGVSFMENKLEWHYKSPDKEQYKLAVKEIEEKY